VTKISADAGRALEILQQIQVLELDRDVEVGGGLVGDDEARAPRLGDGADDPLPHAAAELVGKSFIRRSGDGMRTAARSSITR